MSEWARPGELEVFATGDTTITVAGSESDTHVDREHGTTAELLRRTGAAVRDVHARPGYRPGVSIPTTSTRRGGETDIVRPLLVRPVVACQLAMSGRLFDPPIDGFRLDAASDDGATDGTFLVWPGSLTGAHVRAVPVSLHLMASPSMVVTVLELVPQRTIRFNRRGFVEDGLRVVDAVANRLVVLCDRPAA